MSFFRLHPQHHVAAYVKRRVQFRFLRQIADARALGGPGLALKILVEPGHDFHQRGFARTVDADDTDFHSRQKVQVDVFKALFATRIGL